MNRRKFIKTTALTAMSMPVLDEVLKPRTNLGLQLYTLRDTIATDAENVLTKIASFGYTELEVYDYFESKIFNMPYADFCKMASDLGMKVTSGHYGLRQAESDSWKRAVEDAAENNQSFMVVPSIPEERTKTIDDYKRVCESLNKAGEICNQSNVRFGYHNHAFEFDVRDGQIPFDVMLKELDVKMVGIELDIYWVVRAGKDPLHYFSQYSGRFEQWHVKDMSKANPDDNADIGTGKIDFKAIFSQRKKSGMKKWYVEQETYPGTPITSVEQSAKYLKSIL